LKYWIKGSTHPKDGLIEPGKPIPAEAANAKTKVAVWNLKTGVIYPNDHSDYVVIALKCCKNGTAFPVQISQAQLTGIHENRAFIAIWGKIWYSDVFGIEHWTKFCDAQGFKLRPGNADKCANYNDTDRNYLPPPKPN
jgi:hypothetical protein